VLEPPLDPQPANPTSKQPVTNTPQSTTIGDRFTRLILEIDTSLSSFAWSVGHVPPRLHF
jgi:hypothetical protein